MLFVQAYVQIEKEYKKDNRRINVMSTGELESTGKEQDYKSWGLKKMSFTSYIVLLSNVVTMFMRATQENDSGIQKQISAMKQEYMQDNRSTWEKEQWSYGV